MSWVRTVEEKDAQGVLATIYQENRAKFGYIMNLVRIQSLRPETMALGRQVYRHLMDSAGGLTRLQRYLIATVVSKVNGCLYWVASHEPDLRVEVQDDVQVRMIQDDYQKAKLDAATRAMLDFAVKMTKTPNRLNSADVERLRDVGFSDEEIVDIAQLAAYFNYSNRLMDSLGVEPDPGMHYASSERKDR